MAREVRCSVFLERSFVYLLLLATQVAGGQESSIGSKGGASLQDVIDRVRSNEEKLTLVKMNSVTSWRREGRLPDVYYSDPRVSRTDFKETHQESEWAQDGIRQRFVRRNFRDGRLRFSEISVIDGEVTKSGDWPELKRGVIKPVVASTRWVTNWPSQLFYRPCGEASEDWPLLSEWLGSRALGSGADRRKLNGEDVFVVDTASSGTSGFRRFYIDCDMGLLMRLEYYGGHPDDDPPRLLRLKEVTKVHQLSNGGWVPLEGRDTLYGDGYTGFTDVHVDVNSISVDRADIPDSLFRLDFPEHTRVFNTIVGYDAGRLDRIVAPWMDGETANGMTTNTREDSNTVRPSRTSVKDAQDANDLSGTAAPRSLQSAKKGPDRQGGLAYGMRRTGRWLGLFLAAAGAGVLVLTIRRKRAR
jgi:hypothetical protein